jgi:endonuclease G, mitochondrial
MYYESLSAVNANVCSSGVIGGISAQIVRYASSSPRCLQYNGHMRRIARMIVLILLISNHLFFAESVTVYVTKTGSKYHTETCSYLSSSKIAISLTDAIEQGYEPGSRCDPPTLTDTPEIAHSDPEKERLALPYYEDNVFFYSGFALRYNEQHEQAEWVAYLLTDNEVRGTVERSDRFRADNAIPSESASLADYRGSGYDRGHLAPAADMKWSEDVMDESFLMSNMSPQVPGFNRGIWKKLEALVRDWAVDNEEVYVVTGPVLTDGPYETLGGNNVAIPKRYYKVVLDYKEPELKAIGFILPNEASSQALSVFAVSVDRVERVTGIDFFHLLPDDSEEVLESRAAYSLWEH